ncbi:PilW family protein [Marinobacter arenosus]|uniref:PilW family protein n=1 Tax=Marinobacter arenosus TaxID=2856822 RepID=UPI001C4BD262|nr:PilW family protein [Marinobacter arenosus]MBW0149432.1 PilW family protein [Marinobacter arenosus]
MSLFIKQKQQGLSLIEIMIALTLGLILTAGLVQIFVSNQKSFSLTAASARVLESGRMSAELLARAVRNADYWGCSGGLGNAVNNLDPNGPGYNTATLGFGEGLEGTDNHSGTPGTGEPPALAGTDSFIVRGVGGAADIKIDQVMVQPSAVLHVNDSTSLDDGDIVFITDCQGGDIFQATNVNANGNVVHNTGSNSPGNYNPGNCTNGNGTGNAHCLSQVYDAGAAIYIPYFEQYYVGQGASGEPALFLRTGLMSGTNAGQTSDIELIEGIENMQVLYGDDSDGDGTADLWGKATDVTMADVVAMRVSLLSRSEANNVAPDQPNISLGGSTYGGDGRLRRVYTFTAAIRNRVGG